MKKVIFTFLVAVLGGLISLAVYRQIENIQSDNINAQKNSIPVRYANYSERFNGVGPDFRDAAAIAIHAVVHIKTEYERKSSVYDDFFSFGPFNEFFGSPRYETMPIIASGSGVIITDDGYIVTNNHVVQEASSINVTLNDKRTYNAKVIGTDPSTDLALIKIDEKNLSYLTYGNSDSVAVGEWVLAVGNPFNLTSTVTAGIVSAKARDINILGRNQSSSLESFIQTDAAVNPGNSGGALVNTNGELIGINAAIASNTGSYAGYSFAIPVNIVRKVVNDLLEFGEAKRAYMGVTISEVDSKLAKEKGITEVEGVYVFSIIENGSADEAGIEEGDIITSIAGIKINSYSELLGVIGQYRPGDKVPVVVKRDGKEKHFTVVLSDSEGNTKIIKEEQKNIISLLGATFETISKEEMNKYGINNGLKITRLEGGKLRSAGIREGFIIISIDKKPIQTTKDVEDALSNKKGGVLIEGLYPNGMRAYYGFGL